MPATITHTHLMNAGTSLQLSAVGGRTFLLSGARGTFFPHKLPEVGYMVPEGSVCSWHSALRAEPLLQFLLLSAL